MKRQLHVSKEFAELQEWRRALRSELGKLVAERDERLAIVKPNLEAKYYAAIGEKQYQLFVVRNEALRLRRKIELIRATLNRGEEPDLELIEEQLDEELQRWVEELQDLSRKIKWAEYHNQLPKLSSAEARELKKLYHELVRQLHPDFNEELPENFKYLWERVLTAYRNGDLEEMQNLALLLEKKELLPEPSTMDLLANDIEKLVEKIKKMLEELSKMQEQFPFNLCDKLDDINWVIARQQEVERQIEEMERHRRSYTRILADLAGGGDTSTVH